MDKLEILSDDTKEKLIELMEDGLQFVDKPKEILCNNCGRIPLFHYIYPCLHPYCRDCYVNVCVRLKKKCRVCKTEVGTKMLQSKKLEATIYKLKTICPNKPFGCNDEIELSRLLDHLLECKFPKEKQLPKLYNDERESKEEDPADRKDLKESIENINMAISNLSKQSEEVLKENKRLTKSNAKLNVKVQKLIGDVKILTGSNESRDRKIAELTEQIEENKNDFKERSTSIIKDVELVDQKVRKLSDIVTEIEPNIKRKVAGDVTDLNKSINESKQLLEDFKETNRKILVKNDELINENQKTLDENKSLAAINKELAFDNSKSISLIEKLFEKNNNITALNEKCMNDYKNLKIDCDQLIQIRHNEVNEKVNRQEENIKTEVVNATRRIETIQEDGNQNTEKIEAVNNNVSVLSTLIDASVNDIVQIRKSQKDSMDVNTAMKGQKNGVLIWEINEFSKKKKMASTSAVGVINYYSDEFYSCEYGYKMKLMVKLKKDQLAVALGLVPGEHDAHLPVVFHHRRTYYILDQSDRKEKRHVVRVDEPRFRDGQPERYMKEYRGYICEYSLLETKHKDVYLKDDRIFLKVVVEPIFPLTKSPYSNDGILMWKVLNYARTKQESQDGICEYFYSDSFYSSTHGYRMKCYLYFDEKQLDIWLFFLEGEFDDSLPDVYAHKVTFSIMDQNDKSGKNNLNEVQTLDPKVIGNEKAKEKLSETECSGAGFLFANFEKNMFLLNDTILIKVEVKPL